MYGRSERLRQMTASVKGGHFMRSLRFMRPRYVRAWPLLLATAAALSAVLLLAQYVAPSAHASQGFYQQTNLVSDLPGVAQVTDPNLVNSWGIVHSSTSPFWIADNGTGVSTLYTGAGTPVPLSAIQNGEVELCTMPQELTRLESVTWATPGK